MEITLVEHLMTLVLGGKLQYCSNLPWNLTLENVGTVVYYSGIFYNIGTWAQYYKTFYHGNLPPFHGHAVFLCYKATLPL